MLLQHNLFYFTMKSEKGVAGLNVLLSVVTLLFVIGLVVMIFALMGGELRDATADKLTAGTVVNETLTPSIAGTSLASGLLVDGACGTVTYVANATGGIIASGNYTQTNCLISNATQVCNTTCNGNWLISYPFTYTANNTATDTMSDTVSGIVGVTDWFAIIIVITAMIVLILLTVIIITAIRGSGLIASA